MEKTIFEKIIDREIPASIIYEDDKCICIVDKFPTTKGQALVISKKVEDSLFNLPKDIYSHMMQIAQNTAKAQEKAFDPKRVCLVVEGFEVPHAHIKLFPVYEEILKTSGGTEISNEEADEIKNKIISALE